MKKSSLILSLVATILFSLNARAEYHFANCSSIQGNPHLMTLVLANQNLLQIRIRMGTRARAFMATKQEVQNIEGVTLYSIRGVAGVMELDNQILTGNSGLVKFPNDEFSCK